MTQIAYPYRISQRGRTASADEDRHLRDLIEQVLFTAAGERVNRPGFGTPILQLVFEPNSDLLANAVQTAVHAALQNHLGGRIVVESLEVANEEATLRVTVVYSSRRTGQRVTAQFERTI